MRGVDPGEDPLDQFLDVMKPRQGRVRIGKPYGPFYNSAPSKELPEGSDVYINFYR